jgi:HD-like signal output (HDOD) protein
MKIPTLEQLLAGMPASLGSYAPVLDEIEAVLESPQCSLASVGEAIEKDPDLTVRLLKLGNSAFYGFATRLSTVAEAVSLIGIQQVQDLILASSIIDQFAGMPPECIDMESFWRHSLACGTSARILALERRLPNADKFFVAGLLHDVGRLVLYLEAPAVAKLVFERYQADQILLQEAENRVLGYDHSDIARALLQRWNYPEILVQAVGAHHEPELQTPQRIEAAVVHFSDYLVNAMQLGSSGERLIPPLKLKTWEMLGLTSETLESLMAAIDEQMQAVEEVFLNN